MGCAHMCELPWFSWFCLCHCNRLTNIGSICVQTHQHTLWYWSRKWLYWIICLMPSNWWFAFDCSTEWKNKSKIKIGHLYLNVSAIYLHIDDNIFAQCVDNIAFGLIAWQTKKFLFIVYWTQMKITQYFCHNSFGFSLVFFLFNFYACIALAFVDAAGAVVVVVEPMWYSIQTEHVKRSVNSIPMSSVKLVGFIWIHCVYTVFLHKFSAFIWWNKYEFLQTSIDFILELETYWYDFK